MRIAVLIFASAAPGLAQDNSAVPIEQLLRSHDPRLVALGASQAADSQDDAAITIMLRMVERWDPAQRHRYQNGDRFDAMIVILDTLIQRKEVVPPASLTAIAYAFPDQALILAARLPFEDAEPLLQSWYESGAGVSRARLDRDGEDRLLLARVSAMMLAKNRAMGFAASVLADSEERFAVSVTSDGSNGVDRCLVDCETKPACQAEVAGQPKEDWPLLYQYTLEENQPDKDNNGPLVKGSFLIEAGGDRIAFRRVPAEVSLNYCYYPSPLTSVTRHHLVAEMLGVDDTRIPWSVQTNLTLPWENDKQFLRELGDQVGAEEARLRATVYAFFAKGLLTRSEMDSTRPRLSVIVFDDRQPAKPANLALPPLAVRDSRTTFHRGSWR
jgi:hypothetical protein